jgi:hypothetical protein
MGHDRTDHKNKNAGAYLMYDHQATADCSYINCGVAKEL